MGTVQTAMTPISQLVEMVHTKALQLPEIQRPYVWYRTQVRDLLDSLYRGYPIGSILVWQTPNGPTAHSAAVAGGTPNPAFAPQFLLDGQQRLTSLTRVFKSARRRASPDPPQEQPWRRVCGVAALAQRPRRSGGVPRSGWPRGG